MNTQNFEEWHSALVKQLTLLGLPELDIDLATLSHLEGMSVEDCVKEYAAAFANIT